MGSRDAFNEVKDILNKLDRSIDEAREKRLRPEQARPEPEPTPTRPSNSQYGRARPLPAEQRDWE